MHLQVRKNNRKQWYPNKLKPDTIESELAELHKIS